MDFIKIKNVCGPHLSTVLCSAVILSPPLPLWSEGAEWRDRGQMFPPPLWRPACKDGGRNTGKRPCFSIEVQRFYKRPQSHAADTDYRLKDLEMVAHCSNPQLQPHLKCRSNTSFRESCFEFSVSAQQWVCRFATHLFEQTELCLFRRFICTQRAAMITQRFLSPIIL